MYNKNVKPEVTSQSCIWMISLMMAKHRQKHIIKITLFTNKGRISTVLSLTLDLRQSVGRVWTGFIELRMGTSVEL